jgi:hypothetical protein
MVATSKYTTFVAVIDEVRRPLCGDLSGAKQVEQRQAPDGLLAARQAGNNHCG